MLKGYSISHNRRYRPYVYVCVLRVRVPVAVRSRGALRCVCAPRRPRAGRCALFPACACVYKCAIASCDREGYLPLVVNIY